MPSTWERSFPLHIFARSQLSIQFWGNPNLVPALQPIVILSQCLHFSLGDSLATSEYMPGLVAQGRTVMESLETARHVARKLMEARAESSGDLKLSAISDFFDYPLIVSL